MTNPHLDFTATYELKETATPQERRFSFKLMESGTRIRVPAMVGYRS